MSGELEQLQRELGRALGAADPVAHWRRHLGDHAVDERGLRMAALLVAKLRFERLVAALTQNQQLHLTASLATHQINGVTQAEFTGGLTIDAQNPIP